MYLCRPATGQGKLYQLYESVEVGAADNVEPDASASFGSACARDVRWESDDGGNTLFLR